MTNKPLNLVLSAASNTSATRDNGVTSAVIEIRYAGGPESLTDLFITQGADIVIIIGQPRLTTNRVTQSKQHYDDYEVPVTFKAINRFSGSTIVSSAPHTLGKAVESFLVQTSAGAHGSDYELMATAGTGRVVRHAAMDIHENQVNVRVRVMV